MTVALGGEPETAVEVRAMVARSTPVSSLLMTVQFPEQERDVPFLNAFMRTFLAFAISSSESSKTGEVGFLYDAAGTQVRGAHNT
jgi:hypothetical protein